MIKYEELFKIVEGKLSERRFNHSKSVVKRALEYSEIYKVDKETAKLCAIAHDVAKELTDEETKYYIDKYKIVLDDIEKINSNLWHSKIGAIICKNEFGFTDDMVNAVRYHTTGRANMSMLEKIIYLADVTEETRSYSDVQEYVDYVKENIDYAMFKVSRFVIEKLSKREEVIHVNTVECYNFYNKNYNL